MGSFRTQFGRKFSLEKYFEIIDFFRAKGKKTFTVKELLKIKSNKNATYKSISKMLKKGIIKTPSQGFYVILSPAEQKHEKVPPDTFIDQWMNFRKSKYYIGLLSASNFYGTSHHRPMLYQVVTSARIQNKGIFKNHLEFHYKKNFSELCLQEVKGRFGYLTYSSPALTCYDLLRYERSVGGFLNAYISIAELANKLKVSDVKNLLKTKTDKTVLQRLGFILDYCKFENLTRIIYPKIQSVKSYTPLSVSSSIKDSNKNKKWNILINIDMDKNDVT